ncbi:hypothetical protein V6N12_039384 [Hibiscus sabdariffa]|uniref:Uncharacterized protein n=1 Tax=Hibiscus sabdariffa TaxID=183260 RepID=A0ABR2E2A3_9ROSI
MLFWFFVEWLACSPDVAAVTSSEVDEKQSITRSLKTSLNKIISISPMCMDDDGDGTCFFNMSRYEEEETGNRLILWEDFELQLQKALASCPVPAHAIFGLLKESPCQRALLTQCGQAESKALKIKGSRSTIQEQKPAMSRHRRQASRVLPPDLTWEGEEQPPRSTFSGSAQPSATPYGGQGSNASTTHASANPSATLRQEHSLQAPQNNTSATTKPS